MNNDEQPQKKPTYTVLGESGLAIDEDGEFISASEIDWLENHPEADRQEVKNVSSSSIKSFGVSSILDDKANPAYWYYYYDPRYCGPSREAYMEKMARQYARPRTQAAPPAAKPAEPAKPSKPTKPAEPVAVSPAKPAAAEPFLEVATVVPEAVRRQAYEDQRYVERMGLHPKYSHAPIRAVYGLNFLAIVDRNGTEIVTNREYFDVDFYYNGRARAYSRQTKKWGFLDIHGNEAIPCIWRSAGQFSEFMVGVQDNQHRCGYLDVTGRVVIPCQWKECWPFHEGLARVQPEGSMRIGMIDPWGKVVIPCQWIAMGDFSEGLAGVKDDEGRCGYIDKSGRVVIPCQWKQVWTFSEGRAVVQDFNGRVGFIDHSGKLVIPCIWKKVSYFKNGVARATKSRNIFFQYKWVTIDKQGRVVES